ncbi:ParB/RepB/Spo0J family partition protein [Streptomyces sp. SB3404]|uniref:ParB/RepB/Spo0J family partition protein n=1 Tax=Streptomyces boncukensis TaxID=2711219 RepID=A0A6G4X2G1_9ACTN|nr:ParB/RepB/Spo0J family partition protein [Streptomyces boncukensis]NGO71070.1 ParB/RepB/Spo0J family partition protein [Streptomyces boncukensis]
MIPEAPGAADGPESTSPERQGSTSPSAVPVLTPEQGSRGVAAAKVAALSQSAEPVVAPHGVSRETEAPLDEVAGAYFAEVPVGAITPNRRQPRDDFNEDALAELVTSIQEVGLLQPIVVRQTGPDAYELVMGERRLRACKEAGLEQIPAIIRATEDDKLLLDALLENLHRVQLNPLEEAAAYDQLLRDFNCTHDQLADRIGRSRSQVSNTLRLLKLSLPVRKRVAAGVLSAGHARALLSVEDIEEQDRIAQRIVRESLSVRAVEEIVTLLGSEAPSAPKARKPRAGKTSPALDQLAGRLSDRFETRVKVDLGQKKGKIVVEFASIVDLERILGQLAPGEGRVLGQQMAEESAEPDADEQDG